MRPADRSPRRMRLLASLILTVLIFCIGYLAAFVAPAPARALYNISANPGGILFLASALFITYGLPLWAATYIVFTLVDRLRSSRGRHLPPGKEDGAS